jgi:hypothetical protein
MRLVIMRILEVLMPKTRKKSPLRRATSTRIQRVLRAVERARKHSGAATNGYTVLLPFSDRLSNTKNDIKIERMPRLSRLA